MPSGLKVNIKRKPEMALKKLREMNKELGAKSNQVKVGLPKGSNNYPDGTSVIMVGSVHEFGSPSKGIPERSYLRSTVLENTEAYKTLLKKLATAVVKGKMTMAQVLNLLGLQVQTDVKEKITDLKNPPLKYRDGNPLIDTGHLRQTITYEVS